MDVFTVQQKNSVLKFSTNNWHTSCTLIMRPSSLGGGRILRRTLSVRLSVRPVIITERHVAPPSELQWHTCTSRHAQRAAYRTAISAAQTCFLSNTSTSVVVVSLGVNDHNYFFNFQRVHPMSLLNTHQVLTSRCGCTLTCIHCRPLFDANNSCSLVGLEDLLVHEKSICLSLLLCK